jgi:hypothetical protein
MAELEGVPYDSEMKEITALHRALGERFSTGLHNFNAVEREIRDRFASIGFLVDINWYEFEVNGQKFDPSKAAMPEITITGRIDKTAGFDHDRMQHEIRSDVLGFGEGGVMKVEPGDLKAAQEHKH